MYAIPIRMSVCSHFHPDWFLHSWNKQLERGERKSSPVPHGFDVAKGSTHMAVTRDFVQYAVSDSKARDLLYWMRDIKIPDEHYFQTLSHNPHMNVPGAFIGQFYSANVTRTFSTEYRKSLLSAKYCPQVAAVASVGSSEVAPCNE